MSRFLTILSIMAVVGFLFLRTQHGQAQSWQAQPQAQSDIGGMDHSKLNHGLLGAERAAASSIEDPVKVALGLGAPASEIPPLSAWAPPVEIAGKAPIAEHRSAAKDPLNWQPPEEIAKVSVERTAAISIEDPVKVALGLGAPASEIPPLSAWAPPAEIAGKAPTAEHKSAARDPLNWQPPEEIAKVSVERTAAISIEDPVKVALGLGAPASEIPPLSAWAPPVEIAGKAPIAEHRSAAKDPLNWQPPEEIAKVSVERTAAISIEDPVKVALGLGAPASEIPPLSAWAPPVEISGKAPIAEHRWAAKDPLNWQPPEEIATRLRLGMNSDTGLRSE